MEIKIGSKVVGAGRPCFIIAEAGVNHNGDLHMAKKMVDVAADAGADAIKFQTFRTTELVVKNAPKAQYQLKTSSPEESHFDMLQRLEMSEEMHGALLDYCSRRDIIFLSTPYDSPSLDLLVRLDVAALKIASTDVSNIPFLREAGQTKRPVLLSTGMSSLQEVDDAIAALRSAGNTALALFQCTSAYPTSPEQINLRVIREFAARYQVPTGFSDHTTGIDAAPLAVAAGACIIEKHFTLSRSLPGPDHAMSIEPDELSELVRTIRRVERMLGDGVKRVMPSEEENKRTHQKSLVVREPVKAGTIIGRHQLTCKRPGTGLPPAFIDRVVGRRALKNLEPDDIVTSDVISDE